MAKSLHIKANGVRRKEPQHTGYLLLLDVSRAPPRGPRLCVRGRLLVSVSRALTTEFRRVTVPRAIAISFPDSKNEMVCTYDLYRDLAPMAHFKEPAEIKSLGGIYYSFVK